ncbi:MAG: ribbon-helix-helix protein, CopG family [Anaerolineae bacterium]|nr:ribbon-helix-helix protein, CopG family [Anaerolineae bacterium]
MSKERRLMVRLTEEQHKAVRVRAAELGKPVSEIVRAFFTAWLKNEVKVELTQEGVEIKK